MPRVLIWSAPKLIERVKELLKSVKSEECWIGT